MAGQEKAKPQELEKWYFTKDQLQTSPSRRCGLDADKELAYRQQAANLIQDMGQRLQVSQLCINTAIVYMHRFYAFHSFTQFHRNAIASAALFLAAKVEEQPRKLEYVIKVAHVCLHRGETVTALTAEQYQEQAQDLVFNENVLLQTLGFDVAIDHPHTHVVRTCHLVKAPKDLAQTSYFMASNSLHLTTMCLQYRPTVVACFCIHLASKWSNWAIPQSNEGRHWFQYVDNSVSVDLLEKLTAEFLHIFDKCPSRLKRKMTAMSMTMSKDNGSSGHSSSQAGSSQSSTPFDKRHAPPSDPDFDKAFDREYEREKRRAPAPGGYVPATTQATPAPTKIDYNAYAKRDREDRERRLAQARSRPPQQPQPHSSSRPPNAHHKSSTHHQWPPHHKPPHHKPPHDKIPHDKIPHDKIPHDKIPHDKIPHDKIPHDKIPHDKIPHDKMSHDKMQMSHDKMQMSHDKMQMSHDKLSHDKEAQKLAHDKMLHDKYSKTHEKIMHDKAHDKVPHEKALSDKMAHDKSHDHRHHRPVVPPGPSTSFLNPPQEVPQRTRPPSLFSPENVTTPTAAAASTAPRRPQLPPQRPRQEIRPPTSMPNLTSQLTEPKVPSPAKKRPEPSALIKEMQPPTIVSPFSSPPFAQKPRQRPPSNSEPELIPVVKKLDDNVIKDSQRSSLIKSRLPEVKREPSLQSRSLNGIETDPTLVSNLLKESLAKPVPITVPTEKKPIIEKEIKREPIPEPKPNPVVPELVPTATVSVKTEETEHKHKKEKKKKEKHKHKDRDKSKEERKKHKKDKDRKRESPPPAVSDVEALKITIPRDKLSSSSPGLKIKIPKERLAAPPPPPQSSGLKIKISKEVLETSRKRPQMPEAGPPQKVQRQNGGPQPHKVGNKWNFNRVPYYMMRPPPSLFYGMDGYYYQPMYQQMPPGMQHMQQPMPHMPHVQHAQQMPPPMPAMPPPLPPLPPPPVPPPPPE